MSINTISNHRNYKNAFRFGIKEGSLFCNVVSHLGIISETHTVHIVHIHFHLPEGQHLQRLAVLQRILFKGDIAENFHRLSWSTELGRILKEFLE